MAGLIDTAMQKGAAPVDEKPAKPQKTVDNSGTTGAPIDDEAVTQEQQGAYEQLVHAGMEILHNEETKPKVIELLTAGKSEPGKALAQVAVMILQQLEEKSGGAIPEDTIVQGTTDILSLAGELAEGEGIFPFDEQTQNQAVQHMMAQLGDIYEVDDEELEEFMTPVTEDEIKTSINDQQQYDTGAMAPPPANAGPPPAAAPAGAPPPAAGGMPNA
jgi:hypothetical protein